MTGASVLTRLSVSCALLSSLLAIAQTNIRMLSEAPNIDLATREASASPAIRNQLSDLRKQIAEQKRDFRISYTVPRDLPLSTLAATRIPRELPPEALQIASLGQRLAEIDRARLAELRALNPALVDPAAATCTVQQRTWDWRKSGRVTPVRGQICGTCWDFTAIGAYEASFNIRNNQTVDASEQYVLNCSKAGNCQGGWWGPVFDFLVINGTASEVDSPFTGSDTQACPVQTATPYRASAWGFVNTSDWTKPPSVAATKEALCAHGPLATAVFVSDLFQLYSGGIFDQTERQFDWINHGIVIIGWDDSKGAWLIKNSWGQGWGETGGYGGEKGYMWIKYQSNNIGVATAWVDAVRRFYTLPPAWSERLRQLKLPAIKPVPVVDAELSKQMKIYKQPAQ